MKELETTFRTTWEIRGHPNLIHQLVYLLSNSTYVVFLHYPKDLLWRCATLFLFKWLKMWKFGFHSYKNHSLYIFPTCVFFYTIVIFLMAHFFAVAKKKRSCLLRELNFAQIDFRKPFIQRPLETWGSLRPFETF